MKVRAFVEDDVPAAAALFARASHDQRWTTRGECERYFRHTVFYHPWRNLDVPSWVVEDAGRLVGFYLLMPRPMSLRGRTLVAAVGCQIAVDPAPRYALAALKLLQACLAGPQDLTFADGAHERSRRMWLAIGGQAPALLNLVWTRLLRPARYAVSLLEDQGIVAPWLARTTRPLTAPADALAVRLKWNRCLSGNDKLIERDLDASTMLANLSLFMNGRALLPIYESKSLAWVLEHAARKTSLGYWRARAVELKGQMLGWYVYYVQQGRVSEVLQIAARDGTFEVVLRSLLADAWRQGAAAVRGRVDPRYIDELSAHHCWFRREGTSVLVHSRHEEVLDALRRGDTFLSRLEGEWYLRFLDG